MLVTRRRFLNSVATRLSATAVGAAWLSSACSESDDALSYAAPAEPARDRGLVEATPSCADDLRVATARVSQGPYYLPQTPERADLMESGVEGESLTLLGTVMNRRCEAIAGAVIDFWHADPSGNYDGEGMRFRGHQFTDAAGGYQLRTLKPGAHDEDGKRRAVHLHAKVQGPGGRVLTTRLYFPEDPGNASDPLFAPETQMEVVRSTRGVLFARFDFVLDSQP